MNILLSISKQGDWIPKIADFGLSTMDQSEMKGMGVGTGRWRAPEVYKKKPKKCLKEFKPYYTNKSDIYSYAIIIWEIFHLGQMPWDGELDDEVNRKVLNGERPNIAPDVPELWRSLMMNCWSHQPDFRPSFAEIIDFLVLNNVT